MSSFENSIKKYKKIGILGLGVTGTSVYKFFNSRNKETICFDESQNAITKFKLEFPEANICHYDLWENNLSHIALSPGINIFSDKYNKLRDYAAKNNIIIICDYEILYDLKKDSAKFIAITGTNGKSTTTALVAHILLNNNIKSVAGGNIGKAALDLDFDSEVFVLELSSYQLELISSFKPDISAILNITPDHLDRYKTMESYIKAKCNIFINQDKNDFIVLNNDNQITKNIASSIKNVNVILFESDNKDDVAKQNYLAAKNICKILGVSEQESERNYKSFKNLPHRMEFIGKIDNINFYNDSKATNAESVKPALYLPNIYWLLGGVPKEGGLEEILPYLKNVKKAYIFGEAKNYFAKQLVGLVEYVIVDNMDDAVHICFNEIKNSPEPSTMLLSPACASFDQYKNFEERGEHFKSLFKKLSYQEK
jgi:UDP-N-acetylmuramoylalanine--D-glutamate ligase